MKSDGNGAKKALDSILKRFSEYYNVQTKNIKPPFCALAEFHSHSEQYFLTKAARIACMDANEYVYFFCAPKLDEEKLLLIDGQAWRQGLEKVQPKSGHKCSDITLIALAQNVSDGAKKLATKLRHYKSHKFGLWGWSAYRALVYETSSKTAVSNWRGRDLKKLASSL